VNPNDPVDMFDKKTLSETFGGDKVYHSLAMKRYHLAGA